ncbi:hypothetical protein GOP47_0005860 [Adiantum capillus-veneris]|uniref:Nudix hydrolase domain-containing protein n=1 Tax=Adiantum capillus-veneris TaxID=13818 RepID=A0A9D4ZNX8_ADICA|nr:hypothetical protein GOP47_0005860 [Adiantum capillus-veneris]
MIWVRASRPSLQVGSWVEARLSGNFQESLASGLPAMHGITAPPTRSPDFEETQAEAELCTVGKRCVSAQDIKSTAALSLWLRDRLPPASAQQVSDWGKLPGTKRVANLWLELSQGEVSLEDSVPPKRTVHVASVKITNGSGKSLLEASQEMADGTMRARNRPLSEKMKPGESVVGACLRGIREELGLEYGAAQCVQMLQDTYEREVQERESVSYPGLMTCYVLHHMVAVMKDLPADDFVTEENELCGIDPAESSAEAKESGSPSEHVTAIGVRRHFWKWVPEQTFQRGR